VAGGDRQRVTLALPFDRVIVGRGAPIVERRRETLAAAYAWLSATSR
jgi:hypothetical protein